MNALALGMIGPSGGRGGFCGQRPWGFLGR